MLVKALALTALAVSTPFAFLGSSEAHAAQQEPRVPSRAAAVEQDLARARTELHAAQQELQQLRAQLDAALDRLDADFQPQRDRNCSPSRNRALMSHYEWLRDQGHRQRAHATLDRFVAQCGDDVHRLNGVAWDLMTDEATSGRFDEVALAIAARMEQHVEVLGHRELDTVALAHFLNGEVETAIERQRAALGKNGNDGDYRRRLATYEAAQRAIVRAAAEGPGHRAETTMVAQQDED